MNLTLNETRIIRDHRMYRVILTAMSHPGSVFPVPELADTDAVTDLLGCLMDSETGFSVIGDHETARALSHRTSARQVSETEADFIIATRGSTRGALRSLKRGTLEYPDQSATVVYQVEALGYGDLSLTLTGPGVDGETELQLMGMDVNEFRQLRDVNAEYPLGIDALFLDRAGRVAAIPRSTQTGVI